MINQKNRSVSTPAWVWTLFVILPVLFMSLMHLVDRSTPLDPAHRVSGGNAQINYSLSPPEDSGWQPVTLPARISTYPRYASVWYRFSVPTRDAPIGRHAFYAPKPNGNLTVFVNGTEIGSGGSRRPPVAQHRAPLMFDFPGALLTNGKNEVLVHRTQMSGAGGLAPFYFGPAASFEADARKLTTFRFWTPFIVLVFMFIVCIIMLALYSLRHKETTYGWYGLALAFWCYHHAWELVSATPVSNPFFWVATSYLSLGGFVFSAAVFVHRFLNHRRPLVERALLVWMASGTLVLISLSLAGFSQYFYFARFAWVPSINLVGVYIVIQLVVGVRHKPDTERISLLLVAWIVVVVGIRDFLWEFDIGVPGSTYYLQFSAGLVLTVFSFILMHRFAHALDVAEILNEELEMKVADRTQALEENFEALQVAEGKRALFEERERIMRDMHDGLGGQLVQMLSVVEREPQLSPIEPELRGALQDLRIIIDSLAPSDGDLLSVLAAFRHRVEKVANRNGIRFRWQVSDVPVLPNLGPERVLNVLRILQECVTNTTKHAGASVITVSTAYDDSTGQIEVVFSDDGTGFDTADASDGYGLENIRRRAREIDSRVEIESDASGTTVRLILQ